jgi:hypothetical protein
MAKSGDWAVVLAVVVDLLFFQLVPGKKRSERDTKECVLWTLGT